MMANVTSLRHLSRSLCLKVMGSLGQGQRQASTAVKEFMNMRTMKMVNGSKVSMFSEAEIASRVGKLRELMEQKQLVACVFTSVHNVCYYTGGFVYCAFGRPYGLVVTPDKHVSISAGIDGGQPWRRSWQDNIIFTDWMKDNFFHATSEVIGNTKGSVGVEFDHINIDTANKIESKIGGGRLVDIGTDTMKLRMFKSPEEIQVIKNGAATADVGGFAIIEAMHEGVREHEVALAGVQAMVRNIAELYPDGELMDTWVWFQSGINTDGAHNPVTTRKVQKGDILSLNCFPTIQGYYTALERTLFLEHASDDHLKLWEANVKVHRRGLELIKPGAKCSDIANELNETIAELGLLKYRSFGYGHSFGILSHYYGREAGLEIREDIDTVLQPGMVVSMEPMITIPEGQPGAGGYREHDILVISQDSTVENITKFPFGPEHNIIKK